MKHHLRNLNIIFDHTARDYLQCNEIIRIVEGQNVILCQGFIASNSVSLSLMLAMVAV